MTQPHKPSDEDEFADLDDLDNLISEFSDLRTYRPTDDAAEPDDVPQAPSGTAMGDAPPSSA
ncbi:hypothetical protein [Streptomyces vilmorinianum]|uniref:hypothetical protein n=1 Tax=Streptomyces vilmorinianum TaxID=3051092 RepID=UPI0010FB37E6|nr:hypothetical protein [Streptomyces vilmorinianum]